MEYTTFASQATSSSELKEEGVEAPSWTKHHRSPNLDRVGVFKSGGVGWQGTTTLGGLATKGGVAPRRLGQRFRGVRAARRLRTERPRTDRKSWVMRVRNIDDHQNLKKAEGRTGRYNLTIIITILKEISEITDVKIDWKTLVKRSSTGISNAREYQMLWRHLAYREPLFENLVETEPERVKLEPGVLAVLLTKAMEPTKLVIYDALTLRFKRLRFNCPFAKAQQKRSKRATKAQQKE
ncbi:hypothetical protein IEQ34_002167 [Dendrobium chrysotoxum]|uniref:Uncharacterized protein n=1 Tax=Dendrobium chrysotoxum TaxID=161865 RepID=A0AAV7HNQ6_DENCH|nr:hypothetical protein IEQ34_002167 [Dendrobium chrysotoxum]